jgi:hypothetical protein
MGFQSGERSSIIKPRPSWNQLCMWSNHVGNLPEIEIVHTESTIFDFDVAVLEKWVIF